MAERTKYTVAKRVKIRGDFRDPGEEVLLTDEERASYAHALEGEDGPYDTTHVPAPGYSTRPMKPANAPAPQRPLKQAQKEAGAHPATRPDRTEPQERVSAQGQKAARPGEAEPQERVSGASNQQEATVEENPSSKGSLADPATSDAESIAEQTTQNDMSDVPHYSYLKKEGSYTTREAIADATDEELEGVAYISSERVADIREVIPYAGS